MTFLARIVFVLSLFAVFLQPRIGYADHMMGADLTWKYLGNDSFEIIVTAYRDCNGIPLSKGTIQYVDECGVMRGTDTLSTEMCCGKDVTPVCKRSCTRCQSSSCSFPFGMQQYSITAKIKFPKSCCLWHIDWNEAARNNAISTFKNSTWQNFYTEATINTCLKGGDNSPAFSELPVAIFCTNQCIVYNPGANDLDTDAMGRPDSLVYSFGQPLGGPGSPIAYANGYDYYYPLKFSGKDVNAAFAPPHCDGFHLDPQTGDISFKAVQTDVTVMVLLVDEYRKDSAGVPQKIGTTRRDLQISLIDCAADRAPTITGINGGNDNSIKICAGQRACFKIFGFDLDTKDSVKLNWNRQIPGATFVIQDTTKKWPVGVFCWTPKNTDYRSYPYRFVVSALDNACPIPARASRAFSVYVLPSPRATHFTRIGKCGQVYFQADSVLNERSFINDYLWTGDGPKGYAPLYIHGRTGTWQYTRAGTWHYTLSVFGSNQCIMQYEDSVTIDPFVEVSLPADTTVCAHAQPISIEASFKGGNSPYSLSWNTGGTTNAITAEIVKDTVFVVYVKDGNGCTNYDSMKVHMQPLPRPDLGLDKLACMGHAQMLSSGLAHLSVITWEQADKKDTVKNFASGDSILVYQPGTYIVRVQDSIGCKGSDTVKVAFNPLVQVIPLDTTVCQNDSVTLAAGHAGPGATYRWYDAVHADRLVDTAAVYTLKNASNTTNGYHYKVAVTQTINGLTCTDTGYKNISVHKLQKPLLTQPPAQCIDNPPFSMLAFVSAAFRGGAWYIRGKPWAIVNNYLYPQLTGITDTLKTPLYAHYRYTDNFKCSTEDSVKVIISGLPKVSAGPDTTVCRDNGPYALNKNLKVTPAAGGLWYAAPGTPANAITYSKFADTVYFDPAKAPADTVYGVIYTYTAANGGSRCNNSDTVYLTVRTKPAIYITPVEPLCANAEPVQLRASPAGGVRTFADSTPDSAMLFDAVTGYYTFYPVKAGAGAHHLLYTAYGDVWHRLCPSADTLTINVVPVPAGLDFTTEDSAAEYCITHAPLKLVPAIAGGDFAGRGVYFNGSAYYFNPSAAGTGSTRISYIMPYNKGKCKAAVSHDIQVDAAPLAALVPQDSFCSNDTYFTIKAAISEVAQISWSSDDTGGRFINAAMDMNTATVQFIPGKLQIKKENFTIILKAWNNGRCDTVRDIMAYNINPAPVPGFTAQQEGCEPFTTAFQNTTTVYGKTKGYEWDFGDSSVYDKGRQPVHTYHVTNGQAAQWYSVKLKVQSEAGCTGQAFAYNYVKVKASPVPVIDAAPKTTTIAAPDVQFKPDEALTRNTDFNDSATRYRWYFGDKNNSDSGGHAETMKAHYLYRDTGQYTVVLGITSKGCTGWDTAVDLIHVKPEMVIYIPNVFKPDNMHAQRREKNYFNDAVNETFQPVLQQYKSFNMHIYNRWGEELFETETPARGWNGRYHNEPAPEGAYVYVIDVVSISGRTYHFTGTVTLLR